MWGGARPEPMRRAPVISLHWEQRRQLASLSHSRAPDRRVALRARIVLRAAEGAENVVIAQELHTTPGTAALWRRRFLSHGIAGLTQDAPRPGRPPSVTEAVVQSVLHATRHRLPPARRRWSVRSLARELGVSRSAVQRIWKAHGILPRAPAPPPRTDSGMNFLDKVTDFVGLYANPLERAMALSTDERVPVGPARSSAPGFRLPPPRRHRAAELRTFLQVLDRETPRFLDVHLLVDSRLGPLPLEVDRWLSRHPRFHIHALPTNRGRIIDGLIDGFSRRQDRPGASASAHRLKNALREHARQSEASPRPFVWTATSGEIRGTVGRRPVP